MAYRHLLLTFDQAKLLISKVDKLFQTYPSANDNQKEFLAEFVRVLHDVTGGLFSLKNYRLIFNEYAAGRSLSGAQLARIVAELAVEIDGKEDVERLHRAATQERSNVNYIEIKSNGSSAL